MFYFCLIFVLFRLCGQLYGGLALSWSSPAICNSLPEYLRDLALSLDVFCELSQDILYLISTILYLPANTTHFSSLSNFSQTVSSA